MIVLSTSVGKPPLGLTVLENIPMVKVYCVVADLLFRGNQISPGLKIPMLHFFHVLPPA